MSQAEDDIRIAVAAYSAVYTSVKPKITLSVFNDGSVQLFLHAPEATWCKHAQGDGKTLDQAAVALKAHLARRLTEHRIEAEKELDDRTKGLTNLIERTLAAIGTLQPPEPSTSEPPKE